MAPCILIMKNNREYTFDCNIQQSNLTKDEVLSLLDVAETECTEAEFMAAIFSAMENINSE